MYSRSLWVESHANAAGVITLRNYGQKSKLDQICCWTYCENI